MRMGPILRLRKWRGTAYCRYRGGNTCSTSVKQHRTYMFSRCDDDEGRQKCVCHAGPVSPRNPSRHISKVNGKVTIADNPLCRCNVYGANTVLVAQLRRFVP